jgi:hypothetical protein
LPLDSNLSAYFATFISTSRNRFRLSSSISFALFAASTEISFETSLYKRITFTVYTFMIMYRRRELKMNSRT